MVTDKSSHRASFRLLPGIVEIKGDISWAMQAVLEDLLKHGHLEQFLRERGWSTQPADTRQARFRKVKFDVPVFPRMVDPSDQAQAFSV